MDDEIEDIDSVNDEIDETPVEQTEEVIEETQEESAEDTTDWKAEALKQKAINDRLAKKLNKPQPVPVVEQSNQTSKDSLSREEAILIAQGMSPEDLDELADVAKAKGISLLKAKETPIFTAYLQAQEAERKKEKAKLGSSKGSQVSQERSISDLTDEEHKALVLETMSKVN